MHAVLRQLTYIVILLAGTFAQAATLQESYEARNWAYADSLQVGVAGFDGTIKDQGNQSLKLSYNCTDPGNWGIVYTTPDFPLESGSPLTTGYSIRVYLEPIGGATGQPTFKLALQGDTEMAGGDTALTANAWTDVVVPAANVTGNYRQVKFIIGSNSGNASGQFNIYVDNFKRDDVLIDGFEPGFSSAVSLVNIDAGSGSPSDVKHLASGALTVGAKDGAMAFAGQWTGDTNNTVEVQHNFASSQDLTSYKTLTFDIYVPVGTALPTVGAFFWDGANGFGIVGAVTPTAHDAWQTLTIDVSSLASAAAPFTPTAVKELKLVLSNAGAAGNIYIDNVSFSSDGVVDPVTPELPAGTLQESYEARSWTYADALQVSVVGFDSATKDQGGHSLKLDYNCTDPGNWGIVYTTPDFPLESGSPLATGYSLRVYLEPIDGATGQPSFKLALQGDSEMGGGDTALTANAWTDVVVPAANVTGAYRQVKFIIGSKSGNASGQFNIYVDNLRRDGVLIDGFEPGFSSAVSLVNIDAGSGSPSDVKNLATGALAAGANDGAMAFAAQWTGDTNNTVEVQHNFAPNMDLSGFTTLTFDLYVPAGTALPTVGAFFWDGANGYLAINTVTATAHDAWQTLTIDISDLATAPEPFMANSVQQLKLVLNNAGAAGTVYLDNMLLAKPVPVNAAKHWSLY